MDVEFSCNFLQRNSDVMVHQSFETSSLTGANFSRAVTSGFASNETGRVVLEDAIVNSLAVKIFSNKVIYGHDFLSVRDRSVVLNNALREMFSIRASHSYQEGNRKGEYPMNGRSRYRLSIERNIDYTSYSLKEKSGIAFVPRLSCH